MSIPWVPATVAAGVYLVAADPFTGATALGIALLAVFVPLVVVFAVIAAVATAAARKAVALQTPPEQPWSRTPPAGGKW